MATNQEHAEDLSHASEIPPHMRETVMFMLAQAAKRAAQSADEALEPLSLDVREHSILSSIEGGPPRSQLEIANSLLIDRTTMARLARELESAGLIKRDRDPRDRRNYSLSLTRAGSETLTETHARLNRVHDEFLGDLDPDQRKFLLQVLRTLNGA